MAASKVMDALTRRFVDDAAIFPPGQAPLSQAIRDHMRWQASPLGERLGPLLLSPHAVQELGAVVAQLDAEARTGAVKSVPTAWPLEVALVARPGTPATDLVATQTALDSLGGCVELVGVELGIESFFTLRACGELPAVAAAHLPLAVELSRDAGQLPDQVTRVQAVVQERSGPVLLKWRTQATPDSPIPTATELAEFLRLAHGSGLPFKLTGGLHHAIAQSAPTPEGGTQDVHGVVNVALAVRSLTLDEPVGRALALLQEREPVALQTKLGQVTLEEASAIRVAWRSFGCCGVTDPLGELVDLSLLPASAITTTKTTATTDTQGEV